MKTLFIWPVFPQQTSVLKSRGKVLFVLLVPLKWRVRLDGNKRLHSAHSSQLAVAFGSQLGLLTIQASLLMKPEEQTSYPHSDNCLVKKNNQINFKWSVTPFLKKKKIVKVYSISSNQSISLILVALYLQWKVAMEWEKVHRKCLSSWWCCKLKDKM